jgi:putative membrane protein insertion efficiency factor
VITSILNTYQKFISPLLGKNCRYIPTCSEYAKEQFTHNSSFFKAFYFTITRLLKCNQLFVGGFDYPIVQKEFKNIQFKKNDVVYWFVPLKDRKNYFKIIKKWS